MRGWQIAAVVGLGLSLTGDLPAQAPVWHTDYARAKAEAKRTGKLLFVVFRCQP